MKKSDSIQPPPPCSTCEAQCCRYVAVEIDTPTCKRDYDQIRWYLLHNGMSVFTDHEGDWFVEFDSHCEKLGPDHRCTAYSTRPRVCADYGEPPDICEKQGDPYCLRFVSCAEYEQYLESKGIDWRWKRKGASRIQD